MLKEVKEKASIQVAHPSLLRLVLEKDGKKGWIIPVIRRDIKEVIDTFHQYYK
ncbi:hypothetical protein L6259_02630 [Candidatus Parcubacteria bacterium]|nr:hypothetical protein [Candidatus Parcubacteria bacterium]